jgi:arginase
LRIPAAGGPSTEDVVAAVLEIRATREVVALDIACTWYPVEDMTQRTELLVALNAAVPPRP